MARSAPNAGIAPSIRYVTQEKMWRSALERGAALSARDLSATLLLAYRSRRNVIRPLSSRHGFRCRVSFISQWASAFAFVSRSVSA